MPSLSISLKRFFAFYALKPLLVLFAASPVLAQTEEVTEKEVVTFSTGAPASNYELVIAKIVQSFGRLLVIYELRQTAPGGADVITPVSATAKVRAPAAIARYFSMEEYRQMVFPTVVGAHIVLYEDGEDVAPYRFRSAWEHGDGYGWVFLGAFPWLYFAESDSWMIAFGGEEKPGFLMRPYEHQAGYSTHPIAPWVPGLFPSPSLPGRPFQSYTVPYMHRYWEPGRGFMLTHPLSFPFAYSEVIDAWFYAAGRRLSRD